MVPLLSMWPRQTRTIDVSICSALSTGKVTLFCTSCLLGSSLLPGLFGVAGREHPQRVRVPQEFEVRIPGSFRENRQIMK